MMRDLIDLLAEAVRDNLVFHSTEWGAEILQSGSIHANSLIDRRQSSVRAGDLRHDEADARERGVCVTRSFYFARQFSDAIFGLDLDRIRQNFKMIPRAEVGAYDLADDHGDFRLEAEEFIVCPALDLVRFCRSIWVVDHQKDNPEYRQLLADPRFAGFFTIP